MYDMFIRVSEYDDDIDDNDDVDDDDDDYNDIDIKK